MPGPLPALKKFARYTGLVSCSFLSFIAVAATLLPLTDREEWFFRVFDYPRLQTFFLALAAFLWFLLVYFRRRLQGWILLAGLATVMVVQAYKAYPYTPLGEKQVLWSEGDPSDSSHISLLICNVLQTNTDYAAVLAEVRRYNPDLFITTESDGAWQRGLSPLEGEYPHRVAVPLPNTYGMHLYSRLPLAQTRVRYLVEADIPSVRTEVRLRSGQRVHLFIVHPRPPVPGEAADSRERDAEIILVGREARRERGGVIVAGDFNDVAWSETTELFQEVTGYLDPRRGRGFFNTFHAEMPLFRWPLDHIFHSSHFKVSAIERGRKVGSDHFPMFIRLSYEPAEKGEQPRYPHEADTEEEASRAIREGKEE